jgi:hypothetical protein
VKILQNNFPCSAVSINRGCLSYQFLLQKILQNKVARFAARSRSRILGFLDIDGQMELG